MSVHLNLDNAGNAGHPAYSPTGHEHPAGILDSDHNIRTKFRSVEDGTLLLAKAQPPAKNKTFGISQPGVPDLDPPTFTVRNIDSFDTKPAGLTISDDEFKRIANEYAADVREIVVSKVVPVYGRGRPQFVQQNSMAVLNYTVSSGLVQRSTLIRENFLATVGAGHGPDEKLAYCNRFLLAGSKYLTKVTEGLVAIDILDVKEWKIISVTVKGKKFDVPLVYLTNQAAPLEAVERRTMIDAEFVPMLGIVPFADEITRDRVEMLMQRAYQYPQWRKIAEKDHGSPHNYLDAFVEGNLRHEGTHGFLAQQLPKASANITDPTIRKPGRADITFSGSSKWELDKEYLPAQFHELAAVGADLATIPCKGALRLLYYIGSVLGTTDGKPPVTYELVFNYLILTLVSIPDLAPDLKKKIEAQTGKTGKDNYSIELIYEIMADPAVTTARVNEIGRKMWSLGYELLRRTEAAHK